MITSTPQIPRSIHLGICLAIGPFVALVCGAALAQKGSGAKDDETERVESFRAEFVRGPDIGIWFARNTDRGLFVMDVATSGAISKAGILEGDRILSVNDQKVATEREFIRSLFAEPTRLRTAKVAILRDGKEPTLVLSPFRLIEELLVATGEPFDQLGLVLDDRHKGQIIVAKVTALSPAFYAGLRAGDEIVTFERTQLTGPEEFARLVLAFKPGFATLSINRGTRQRYVELEIPKVIEGRVVHPALSRTRNAPPKQRTDPGGLSPGGEVPHDPKPVPPM